MTNKRKAFTLMEMMIVIVIVSIIAAFGFPNYGKAINKADEHNMIVNLATIKSTLNLYLENGGTFASWGNLATVNTNLGISILDKQAITYSCCASCNAADGDAMTNGCVATHPKGWSLRFHEEHSSGAFIVPMAHVQLARQSPEDADKPLSLQSPLTIGSVSFKIPDIFH